MMLSPPLPLKLVGIVWNGGGCRARGECSLDDGSSSDEGGGDCDATDRLSDSDGGLRFVVLLRFKLAILEAGGMGKMGIGLMGLGELLN